MNEATAFNTAQALHRSGQIDEARKIYEKIVKRNPRHFDSLCQLAIVAYQSGHFAEAVRINDLAARINPSVAGVHGNRGTFLLPLKRYEEALAAFDRAVALNPNDAQAWNNRGVVLHKLGRSVEALASIDRALALNANYFKAHSDRGYVLTALQRYADAVASCDRAIALQPGAVEAHDNRGVALSKLGRYAEALASFDRALALQPGYAVSHRNRGGALEMLKRPREAIASYDAAVAHDPHIELAAGHALHLSQQLCDWNGLEAKTTALLARTDAGEMASAPFAVLSLPSTLAQQRKIGAVYSGATVAPALPRSTPAGRIRVGYFSADFNDHAVAHAVAGMMEHHDRTRFEVTGFLITPRPADTMQQRLREAMEHFVDVSAMSDQDAAACARERGIDIAVDLMGHTTDSRPGIFAHRAAPVQVGYLGYPGPSGHPALDYLLADAVVVPAEHWPHYSEKIVTLPHSFMPTDSTRTVAERAFTRAELGLPENGVVFCCFNNAYKITPEMFGIWMRLLMDVEGSVLWLSARSDTAQANLKAEAHRRGVPPERLVFNTVLDMPSHLARHRAADIFLDTFQYGAHSTAIDALWAGLPVLTKRGDTFAGRVGASLLTALDMPELITITTADYERAALDLARDPEKLKAVKAKVAANRKTAPLFDTKRFTRNIETAYTLIWGRYQAGDAPSHIEVTETS